MYAGTAPYGSPNQSLAITHFVEAVISNPKGGTNAQPLNQYCNPANVNAGLDAAYAAGIPAGKMSIQYEGGPDWKTRSMPGAYGVAWGGHVITPADSIFLTAALDSATLGTAMTAYLNATAGIAKTALPSIYFWLGAVVDGASDRRWTYAGPDTYASGTEGQALLNSGPWVAMSARNSGLD
jgi:hypothetical protein